MNKEEIKRAAITLAQDAVRRSDDANDAMKLAQASLNLANAYAVLSNT